MSNSAVQATMTPEQVAQRWGTTGKTVRAMLCNRVLHGFKTGTRGPKAQWRILTTEVERFERGEVANA